MFGKRSTQFLYCCFLLQGLFPLQAQMAILGLGYGPLREKYEEFPPKLKRTCANLGRRVSQFGYFAHYASDGAEYYAVMDTSTPVNDDAYGWGSIVFVHGSSCSEGDLDWALRGIPPISGYHGAAPVVEMPGLNAQEIGVPPGSGNMHYVIRSAHEEDILRGLVRDAIQRAIQANGGEAIVKKTLCAPENLQRGPTVSVSLPVNAKGGALSGQFMVKISALRLLLNPSDSIDPASWGQNSIQLLDASGKAVQGTVRLVNKQELEFTAAKNLIANTKYTVKVNGFTDIDGDAVTPYSEPFISGTVASANGYIESSNENEYPLVPMELRRFCVDVAHPNASRP